MAVKPEFDQALPDNVIDSSFRYGCHSLDRERGENVVSGAHGARWLWRFSKACGHDQSATDPACEGCPSRRER